MTENLAKGHIFRKLDRRYSNQGRRTDALRKLADRTKTLAQLGQEATVDGTPEGEKILDPNRPIRPGEFARAMARAKRLEIVNAAEDRVNEQIHVEKHWFSQMADEGWWADNPDHPVEEILREALIQALEVANTHDLPVDTYWVCAGENHPFEAFVCWNPQQVTLIILTPGIPRVHDEQFDHQESPVSPGGTVDETKQNQPRGIMAVRRHKETKTVMVRPVRLEDGGSGPINVVGAAASKTAQSS